MHRDQRGIAIVMAMGIVSLAAIAATATLVIQSTWFRQRELAGQYAQAQMLVPVALDWARAVIGDNSHNSSVTTTVSRGQSRFRQRPFQTERLKGISKTNRESSI